MCCLEAREAILDVNSGDQIELWIVFSNARRRLHPDLQPIGL
jgi:hypothetical protein